MATTYEKNEEKPSPIYLHSVVSKLLPNFVQLTDYMPELEAKKEEERYIKEYSRNWTLLNSSKGGELGTCSYKWTKKAVFERVNVCSSYLEFREKFPGAYSFALKRKWNKEIELILPKKEQHGLKNILGAVLENVIQYMKFTKISFCYQCSKSLGYLRRT